ncbi:MAG: alpha/beta hydrolase-fold protein [Verrucomicrobiota bacterium]
MLAEFEISSDLLPASRKVWVQDSISPPAEDCLILLDGEMYRDRVVAPELIRDLQETGRIPPLACVYLSLVDTASRHADLACNESFSRFLASELLAWIERTIGHHERYFIGGMSLGGLAAAFTVLSQPGIFAGALCQSPSAWWNDEWLAGSVTEGSLPQRFWLSVGRQELQKGIAHPPSGMLQKICQLDSVRHLTSALTDAGHETRLAEFDGGHDPACWAAELPEAMDWLMKSVE